ncbi:unnamed protein product, partial [marine sediment metagenome]
ETNAYDINFSYWNSTYIETYALTYPTGGSTNYTFASLKDDTYSYNVVLKDYAEKTATTLTRTITLDNVIPTIYVPLPMNTTYTYNDTFFWVNSTERLDTCKLTLNNWITNYTMERGGTVNDSGVETGMAIVVTPFESCIEMRLDQTGTLNITLNPGLVANNFSNPSFIIRDENQILLETINISNTTNQAFSANVYTGNTTYGICINDIDTYSSTWKYVPRYDPANEYTTYGDTANVSFKISTVSGQIYYNESMPDG